MKNIEHLFTNPLHTRSSRQHGVSHLCDKENDNNKFRIE